MKISVTHHRGDVVVDLSDDRPLAIVLTPRQAKELAENLLSAAVQAQHRPRSSSGWEAMERGEGFVAKPLDPFYLKGKA